MDRPLASTIDNIFDNIIAISSDEGEDEINDNARSEIKISNREMERFAPSSTAGSGDGPGENQDARGPKLWQPKSSFFNWKSTTVRRRGKRTGTNISYTPVPTTAQPLGDASNSTCQDQPGRADLPQLYSTVRKDSMELEVSSEREVFYLDTEGTDSNYLDSESDEKRAKFGKVKQRSLPVLDNIHTMQIAGVSVKLPVKPYPCQIAVMNMLIKGCTKQENCLLESPTGSGKTLALLCGALAWQDHYYEEMNKLRCKDVAESILSTMESEDLSLNMPESSSDKCCAEEMDYNLNPSKRIRTSDKFNVDEEFSPSKINRYRVPKIYYGSRTHRQIDQIIKEFQKTVYRDKRMTILSSREFTCIRTELRNKTELCNELLDPLKGGYCKYYDQNGKKKWSNDGWEMLKTPWDIEDLVTVGKRNEDCPYFTARSLMTEANIIFCPYNYLVDPDIRESMQIELNGEVVILDEAHNIEDSCRDMASVNITDAQLYDCAQDCEQISLKRPIYSDNYTTIQNYLLCLARFINHVDPSKIESGVCWTGTELVVLFDTYGLVKEKLNMFLGCAKAAITDFNKTMENIRKNDPYESHEPVISRNTKLFLGKLSFALEMITSDEYRSDYRACVKETTTDDHNRFVPDDTWTPTRRKTPKRVRTLQFVCMNPAVVFAPIAKSVRCIALASGTLTPISSFQSELGTKFPHVLQANHVIPSSQVYVRCLSHGPTGVSLKAVYSNVNTWDYKNELGRVLVNICKSVPHGVLCFFPSYTMMNNQIAQWESNGSMSILEDIKYIFTEPRNSSDLEGVMSEYRQKIEETSSGPQNGMTGALLFAVFRGKVAEGIDFSDNEARCVATVGIPFAMMGDSTVKMKFEYNNLNTSKGLLKGRDWYAVQAFRALNQALGRCIRHRNDWGAILLLDERHRNKSDYRRVCVGLGKSVILTLTGGQREPFLQPCPELYYSSYDDWLFDRFLEKRKVEDLPKWVRTMWVGQVRCADLGKELEKFVTTQRQREMLSGGND